MSQAWKEFYQTFTKATTPAATRKSKPLPDSLEEMVPIKRERDEAAHVLDQMTTTGLSKRRKTPTVKVQLDKKERPSVVFDMVTNNYVREENNEVDISPFDNLTEDLKTEEDVDFIRKMETLNKTAEEFGNILPDQKEVMQYMEKLEAEEQPPWYNKAQENLLLTQRKYPQMPVLHRGYLLEFLRAAKDGEAECAHPNCKSLEMGGFRCRELLIPNDKNKPLEQHWCYICHLYETTRLYWECFNTKWQNTDISKPYTIHYFIVYTDRIGEYKLSKTIQGDGLVNGIYGPVPLFNVNNYVKDTMDCGVWGWRESDALVFRPAQKVSEPSKSYRNTRGLATTV